MRNYVDLLTGNRIINIGIFAWLTAQVLKALIILIVKKKLDFERLVGGGGMPSSHSAFVVSVAVAVGRLEGVFSTYFAIAVCLALIVMYDASNVRRAAGEQAKILNYMMDHWHETTPQMFGKELKEFLGHTNLEVVCGALLGFVFGLFA